MSTKSPAKANQGSAQPFILPSGNVDERIARVENGLVVMSADWQPQWGNISTLAERITYYHVPGVSVAVIDDYKTSFTRGYGERSAGKNEPVTTQTLFHAGSVAKSLSAAAMLALVEQGMLNLDDDVNKQLLSWQVPENEYTGSEKVTMRRLLSHSAGLKDGLTDRNPDDPMPAYMTYGDDVPRVPLQQLLDGMPEDDIEPTRVVTVPGTSYRYTNADYAILELLVQDRIGRPFEEFMQAIVLDRLGLASSSYHQPLPQVLRTMSASEHTSDGKPMEGGGRISPFTPPVVYGPPQAIWLFS